MVFVVHAFCLALSQPRPSTEKSQLFTACNFWWLPQDRRFYTAISKARCQRQKASMLYRVKFLTSTFGPSILTSLPLARYPSSHCSTSSCTLITDVFWSRGGRNATRLSMSSTRIVRIGMMESSSCNIQVSACTVMVRENCGHV